MFDKVMAGAKNQAPQKKPPPKTTTKNKLQSIAAKASAAKRNSQKRKRQEGVPKDTEADAAVSTWQDFTSRFFSRTLVTDSVPLGW
jgi:hypothetical protein